MDTQIFLIQNTQYFLWLSQALYLMELSFEKAS